LIALDFLGLLPLMATLFATVLIPKAVRKELFRRRRMKDRIQSALRNYAFLQPCDEYDQGAADVLLIERSGDRGEAEAIVQASQSGAVVIVDDRWGRRLASQFDLEHHGTLWVLERFYETGLISSNALREFLMRLLSGKYRMPLSKVDELLMRIGEKPIGS
jgi:predicted nucleic acid-binding protein